MKTLVTAALLAIALPLSAANHFSIYAEAGKSTTNRHGQSDIESLNFDFTHTMRTHFNLELGNIVSIMNVRQPQTFFGEGSENAQALYLALLARHNFRPHGSLTPYVELLSGAMYGTKDIPPDTERFNFNSQGGVGVFFGGTRPIMLGVRIGHISNLVFGEHNPGINYSAIVVGVRLR